MAVSALGTIGCGEQMALITCPECEYPVSSSAATCPQCGHPLSPVVIEQTDKRWKMVQLVGGCLTLVSCLLVVVNMAMSGRGYFLSCIAFLVSCCVYFAGRLGAWWEHG